MLTPMRETLKVMVFFSYYLIILTVYGTVFGVTVALEQTLVSINPKESRKEYAAGTFPGSPIGVVRNTAVELVMDESTVVVAISHPTPIIAPPIEGVVTVEEPLNMVNPWMFKVVVLFVVVEILSA